MIYVKEDENEKVLAKGFSKAVAYMSGADEWLEAFWATQIASLKAHANELGCEQRQTDKVTGLTVVVTPKRCNKKVAWSFTFED